MRLVFQINLLFLVFTASVPAAFSPMVKSSCGELLHFLAEQESLSKRYYSNVLLAPAKNSARALFPEYWTQLSRLRTSKPDYRAYFPSGIKKKTPVNQLLQSLRENQNKLAAEAEAAISSTTKNLLALRAPYDDWNPTTTKNPEVLAILRLHSELMKAVQSLQLLSAEEAQRLRLPYPPELRRSWSEFRRALIDVGSAEFVGGNQHKRLIHRWGKRTDEFWRVLEAAMSVPNLESVNRPLPTLVRLWSTTQSKLAATLNGRPPKDWNQAIPLIWKLDPQDPHSPLAWGEVLVTKHTLSLSADFEPLWKNLTEKIQSRQESARRLGRQVRQVIFLPTGVTPAARERLLSLGFDEVIATDVTKP